MVLLVSKKSHGTAAAGEGIESISLREFSAAVIVPA